MDSTARYVIARRLGDFDEYLQDDGNFGPLTDHQGTGRFRRDTTRVFLQEVEAKAVVRAYENKHPTVSLFVKLEIKRIP
jgi:hypothetical protein